MIKKIVATLLVLPTLVLAAGDENWKLTGVTKDNVDRVKKALEDAHDVDTAVIDITTGNVTLKPDAGQSIDDKDVIAAAGKVKGVSISKLQD